MPFETKYSDKDILEALEECLKEAKVPASEIAKKLDGNPEYIKKRLLALMKEGIVEGKRQGKTWGFCLK